MRAYLLGRATEAEAAHLEARLIDDEEVFETLRGVEDDLFDEYAQGTLGGDERERFVERYGAERGRLIVAHALAARTARSQVVPFRRFDRKYWFSLAAAAAVIAVVGITLWLRTQPVLAPGPLPAPAQVVVVKPAFNPAVLIVTLATSRSAASTPEAALTPDTPALELRVRLHPEDHFDRYVMTLRSTTDRVVWTDENPRLLTDGGDRFVVGTVPASVLDTAAYELAVRGVTSGGPPEALGFAQVNIRR
jgi:hypothetical protein